MPFTAEIMIILTAMGGAIATLSGFTWKLVQQMFEVYREQIKNMLEAHSREAQNNEDLLELNKEQGEVIKRLEREIKSQGRKYDEQTKVINNLVEMVRNLQPKAQA